MRTFCGKCPCRALPEMAQAASGCLRVPKCRWAWIAEGLRRAQIRKGVRMSPWRLAKKILEQVFGVGLRPVLSLGKLCPARCMVSSGRAGAGTLPAPCGQCRSGKFCSTAQISPSGYLREKGQHHCLCCIEGETERT